MTGKYATFGEQMKRGAEMAVKDINAAGGVNRQAAQARDRRRCLRSEAGRGRRQPGGRHESGRRDRAISARARRSRPRKSIAKAKILQITPASTNPKLTDEAATKKWNNVLRVCGRDDAQGDVAGRYLAACTRARRSRSSTTRRRTAKASPTRPRRPSTRPAARKPCNEAIKPGEKDFAALVSKHEAAGIEVVYFGGYAPEAALMVRQAREQNFKPIWISGDALDTDEFWKIDGPGRRGLHYTQGPDPRNNPLCQGRGRQVQGRQITTRRATRSTPTPRFRCGRRP